ncbi:MAG: hypothetical protein V1866_04975 [archaeon]
MITEDKWFYFVGGRKASSIEELRSVLEAIDDNEFTFHCNSGKNDFANWVEGIFAERDLARRMRGVAAKNSMIILLAGFLNENKVISRKDEDAGNNAEKDAEDDAEEKAAAAAEASAVPDSHDDNQRKKGSDPQNKSLKPLSDRELADYFKLEDKQASNAGGMEYSAVEEQDDAEVEAPVSSSSEPSEPTLKAPEPPKDESAAQREIRMADLDIHNMMMGKRPLTPQAEEHRRAMADLDMARKRLVVKEFIYGFVIGLVFGLIMLGVLFNLKC